MANDTREPQSYGSQGDWTSGKTGQQVHDQKSPVERVEESSDDSTRGGLVSDVQLADNAQREGATSGDVEMTVQQVTGRESGAKRGSFFRRRDYE